MENASKALIMAASVLLGLMIISIGVTLYSTFADFSRTTLEKVEETKLAEWNNQFLKYYGTVWSYDEEKKKDVQSSIKVTAHDIVTLANLAKQNNENYELSKENAGDENTYYVQVFVENQNDKFETEEESKKNKFLQDNSLNIIINDDGTKTVETKYYECTKVKISEVTKRVMYIEFKAKK